MAFEKGNNLGGQKPKGAVSKRTRVATEIVATFDETVITRLNKLKNGTAREFKEYMTYIMALLPKLKELTGEDGERLMPDGVIFGDANIIKALETLRSTSKPS